jgi:hypothetical protein
MIIIFGMGEDKFDENYMFGILDFSDYSKIVSADIEYRKIIVKIGASESLANIIETHPIGIIYDFNPFAQRQFRISVDLPILS